MSRSNSRLMMIAVLLIIASVLAAPLAAQDQARISGRNALEYDRVLTQEKFASRNAGFEGGKLASAWIADQFKAWGLEPAGTNGYFQDFTDPIFHVDAATLKFGCPLWNRVLNYEEEWNVAKNSGSAEVNGEIIFVGYGISDEKAGWNDYAGLDLKGKVVAMIPYGMPAFLYGKVDDEKSMPEAKIAKAYELGARAVLLLDTPKDFLEAIKRYPFPTGADLGPDAKPDMAVVGLNYDATKALFRDSGIELVMRTKQMEKDHKSISMPLGIRAELNVKTTSSREGHMRNVLAKITGSDPVLKNEYIVIGAHYDHLGNHPDGRMNPGADDNASGTAVVMELARAMKAGKDRPKRTVIFALWDGEEQGLFGSSYYVTHPVHPIDKTIVNLNLDMVAHGDGGLQYRGVYYGTAIWDLLKKNLPADIMKDVVPSRGGPGGSDHSGFLAMGVPGFFIATSGQHYGRHDVGDKFDLVDPALLEKSGNLVKASVDILANSREIKNDPQGKALNLLRSSTLVDLTPRRASDVVKDLEPIEYPDLDFTLAGLEGRTALDLVKSFYGTQAVVNGSKKAVLYKRSNGYGRSPYGPRVGIMPGITDLSALEGHDDVLKLLGRAGLGFITVRDEDLARNEEETRRMVAAANATGVLVIARLQPANAAKVLDWATQPGLLFGGMPDEAMVGKLQMHQWRLALEWKAGMTPEAYAGIYQQAVKSLGPRQVLAQAEGYSLKGFSPALIKLASLIGPKNWGIMEISSGGLDSLGQNFLTTLMYLRPMDGQDED